MAEFRGTIKSEVLGMQTNVNVTLPYDFGNQKWDKPCKVIYLLHGHSDNASAWQRWTSVERYANLHGYAIVSPEVQRSFYTDMDKGLKYFTYISDELPKIVESMFNVSNKREDRYIAGLSMGGYGAIKCGLRRPDLYAGCAGFSGVLDISQLSNDAKNNEEMLKETQAIFGDELTLKSEDDLFYLANQTNKLPANKKPKVFVTCGTEDFLYKQNVKFNEYMEKLSYDYKYVTWSGVHEWGFWDKSIQLAMNFFDGIDEK